MASAEPRPCSTRETDTRVYVACLAAYNNGILHGKWLDLIDYGFDADCLQEAIDEVLAESPIEDAEEWAIHDYEGFACNVSENHDLDDLCEQARLLHKHGAAYRAYLSWRGIEYASESDFDDAYSGEWNSESDFAQNLLDDCYSQEFESDLILARYFDLEAFTRDLFTCDYHFEDGHVFDENC